MAQMPTLLTLSAFTWGLAIGMMTVFILEHSNYMKYLHEYVDSDLDHKTNTVDVIQRNSTSREYKADADNVVKQNRTTQEEAKLNPRILCWIMTNPTNIPQRAKSVRDTWGKRCDILLFFSSKADPSFPAIGLNVIEEPHYLFDKARASLEYIYQHHVNDADWFLKADDDSYVIIENVRHMLSKLNTSDPHYIGRMLTSKGGYNHGGACYVFSRETLRRFKKVMGEPSCPQHYRYEDVAVGKCLKAQGVRPVSTRDSSDRETFMPFALEQHLIRRRSPRWIRRLNYPLPYKEGYECCSDYPNTFHQVKPEMMHELEYLIYRVKVRP